MSNRFLETFISEYIEVVLDFNITTSVNADEEGRAYPVEMPLTVAGFVMDVDDMFVYLSSDGEEINQAMPLKAIKHAAIVDVNAKPEDKILDEMPDEGGSYH